MNSEVKFAFHFVSSANDCIFYINFMPQNNQIMENQRSYPSDRAAQCRDMGGL